jgi:hypothetical protein
MVVCSHVKGHINAGYAGAIKNLAMGGVSSAHRNCGWKCGRGAMHTIGAKESLYGMNRNAHSAINAKRSARSIALSSRMEP